MWWCDHVALPCRVRCVEHRLMSSLKKKRRVFESYAVYVTVYIKIEILWKMSNLRFLGTPCRPNKKSRYLFYRISLFGHHQKAKQRLIVVNAKNDHETTIHAKNRISSTKLKKQRNRVDGSDFFSNLTHYRRSVLVGSQG